VPRLPRQWLLVVLRFRSLKARAEREAAEPGLEEPGLEEPAAQEAENVYLVEDYFGRKGCVWREADSEGTDLETVIADLMSGQYHDPRRVIAFNIAERWSEDVSEDVAREIQRRADLAAEDISSTLGVFIERYTGPERQMVLGLT
jgi:hypothetical protein